MSAVPGKNSPEDQSDRPKANTFEIEEGREHWRFWMPRYIVGLFAGEIGQRGVALYCSLAWWLTSDAPHHRPTLKEIGLRAGCSRATVWRGLKTLKTAGLIEVAEQITQTGRRAHKIRLVHPAGAREYEERFGTQSAGGSNLSAPRAQDERAARSKCARGARNLSAPSGSNLDPTVCVNAAHTHTEDALTPEPKPLQADVEEFVCRWMAALPPGAAQWTGAHVKESADVAKQLLEGGWLLAELLTSLADPARARGEWPREYAARHGAAALLAARRSAPEAQERQRRTQTLEQARAETARRLASKARYDALDQARKTQIEAELVKANPLLAHHPGFLAIMAAEKFGELPTDSADAPLPPGPPEESPASSVDLRG